MAMRNKFAQSQFEAQARIRDKPIEVDTASLNPENNDHENFLSVILSQPKKKSSRVNTLPTQQDFMRMDNRYHNQLSAEAATNRREILKKCVFLNQKVPSTIEQAERLYARRQRASQIVMNRGAETERSHRSTMQKSTIVSPRTTQQNVGEMTIAD